MTEQDRVPSGDEVDGVAESAPLDAEVESDAPVDTDAQPETPVEPGDPTAELTADLQRLQADFANYRRRAERDRQGAIEFGKSTLIGELLPVLDDLERARSHGDLEAGPLRSVADKITETLVAQGLTAFGAEGDAFDPALHEAVQHEGDGANPVLGQVYRQGYRLGDRVLRTAMVVVIDGNAS